MKVVFVDQSGVLGGGELSLLDVIAGLPCESRVVLFSDGPFRALLAQAGVQVDVLTSGALADVRTKASLLSLPRSLSAVFRLRNHLVRLSAECDLLYANSQKAFIVAALAARASGIPLVWHLRDMLTAEHFSPLLRRVAVALANRHAQFVIVNSNSTGEAFIAVGGNAGKVRVVYNGISPEPFDALDPAATARLRTDLAKDAQFVVGVFGRLSPWKGQHIAMEAIRKLPGVHLLVVGDALFGEYEYQQQLRKLAEDAELRGRVHFLGFRRDIPDLMKAVDVVVHSSTAPEPFGRVLVEGMLANRPVIATAAGGATEIIEHQRTGILVPPGDSAALAAEIGLLEQRPDLASQIAIAGCASARSRFSREAMVQGVQSVLSELRHTE